MTNVKFEVKEVFDEEVLSFNRSTWDKLTVEEKKGGIIRLRVLADKLERECNTEE
jgi:hypothetical protein